MFHAADSLKQTENARRTSYTKFLFHTSKIHAQFQQNSGKSHSIWHKKWTKNEAEDETAKRGDFKAKKPSFSSHTTGKTQQARMRNCYVANVWH
jgi:hypothetical protein